MHTEEMLDRAALYALGALGRTELAEFEDHLEQGCAVCQAAVQSFRETASAVGFDAEPVAPPPSLRATVLAAAAPRALPHLHVVRSDEGRWKPTGLPGIESKVLFFDREQNLVTTLLRMAPGSTIPRHRHSRHEQCLVVEGMISSGDLTLRAGDFQCAFSGSLHDPIHTTTGCVLMLIAAPHDEFVA